MNFEDAFELIAAYSPKVHHLLGSSTRYPQGENAQKIIKILLDDASFWATRRPAVARSLLEIAEEMKTRTMEATGPWMRKQQT